MILRYHALLGILYLPSGKVASNIFQNEENTWSHKLTQTHSEHITPFTQAIHSFNLTVLSRHRKNDRLKRSKQRKLLETDIQSYAIRIIPTQTKNKILFHSKEVIGLVKYHQQ